VFPQFIRKRIRRIKRRLHSKRFILLACVIVLFVGAIGYASYMNTRRLRVDPVTYKPLLQLIARAESKDNYNAYFGNASNTAVNFTAMSLAEVLQWQADFVRSGSPSSAVGRYQIMNTTLTGLVQQLGLDKNEKFDQPMQDKLAITLLERRGSEDYVNNQLSRNEFAANLAREWAALPKVTGKNPSASYYAGDGLNKSLVSVDDVQKAIAPISAK
jgi:muramidase (phage lysozyme)